MKIAKDSLWYRIWSFTFLFSTQPKWTTRRRFWLRTMLLPVPVVCIIIVAVVFWALSTIGGNVCTILTGYGVFNTWSGSDSHVRRFRRGLTISRIWISPTVVAGIIWVSVAGVFLGYLYPQEFDASMKIAGLIVAGILSIGALTFFAVMAIKLADKREYSDDQDWDQASPGIVTFVDSANATEEKQSVIG